MNLFLNPCSNISNRHPVLRHLPFKLFYTFLFILILSILGLFLNCKCLLVFQEWLASYPFYGILRNFLRAPNGNLDPLKYLLGQTTFMNYVLAAINEISRIRVYGIEIRQAVDYYFPAIHRLFMQVIFYTFFSISGHFAYLKDRGFISALCLIGMFSCLFYTIRMFFTLFPFARKQKRLVQKYIHKKHDLDHSSSKKIPPLSGENTEKHIMELATYIGQQWNKNHLKHIETLQIETIEKTLVLLVQKSLGSFFYYFSSTKSSESPSDESGYISSVVISDSFAAFFPKTLKGAPLELINNNVKTADYVLYVGCFSPPLKNNSEVARFQKMCRHCKSIWKQLFYAMDDTYQKCYLAYILLQDSLSVNKQLFTLMACGLLQCLWSFALRSSDDEIQTAQQSRCFLFTLHEIDLHSAPEKQLSEQLTEILCITAGLIQWNAFCGILPDTNRESETSFIVKKISLMELSSSSYFKLHKNQSVYSIYAFLLFSSEHSDILKFPSVRIIQNIQQTIQEIMQKIFSQKNISVRRPYDE